MGPINIFYNKILRSFLKISNSSPVPALYFLLGELPIEARLHMDFLSLFFNIWNNPGNTIHKVVQYLLKMADKSSLTWSAHLRILCLKYNLPDPLQLLQGAEIWQKSDWSLLVTNRVTVFHERSLRELAATNSKMQYLNVQVQGLSGTPHPALMNIYNMQEVKKLRLHIKFLSGDFLTAERQALDNGTNPQCKLCLFPEETVDSTV